MTTNREITAAIKKTFDIPGVKVHSSDGCCIFYSDDNEEAGSVCAMAGAVYVCHINHLTVEQWLCEFWDMWQQNCPRRLKLEQPRPDWVAERTFS